MKVFLDYVILLVTRRPGTSSVGPEYCTSQPIKWVNIERKNTEWFPKTHFKLDEVSMMECFGENSHQLLAV